MKLEAPRKPVIAMLSGESNVRRPELGTMIPIMISSAPRLSVPFALVIIALLACKGGDKSSSTSPSASAGPAGAAPSAAPTPASDISAEQMGTFTCKDVKDDVCVEPTSQFDANAPVIHVSYKTKDLPKNGDVFSIQWIAEDVGASAKPNTIINTLEKKVEGLQDYGVKNYVVNAKLSKPTAGWPLGKYRTEIKHGDKLVTTARFEVR
jgi:hypothetical protein